MSSLSDLTDALKRRVAVPGTFSTLFPTTTDTDLAGSLLDAFAGAQLDGFFLSPTIYNADDTGIVTPDMTRAQGALVVMYAAINIIRTQLTNLQTSRRYKAGNNEYEVQSSANVLTALLKQLNDEKQNLITRQALLGSSAAFTMADQYLVKAVGIYPGYSELFYSGGIDRAYDYEGNLFYGFPP